MEEEHIVKRAIIMAAGIGKRMQPLTIETPKPLVSVNGVRMIDTVIDALHKNNINEIYVVVGYLKEKFYDWARGELQKTPESGSEISREIPGVTIIENPYYDNCNNISSLYVAREYLEDCIILDGDQIIYNPDALAPNFTLSGYNAVWCEEETDEWLMQVKDGLVTSCSRTGGSHGWQLYSISRWSVDDGRKLREHLEFEFNKGNTDIYWDDVAMFCHFGDYRLGIREMQKRDIIEIDDLEELIALDSSYEKYRIARKNSISWEE